MKLYMQIGSFSDMLFQLGVSKPCVQYGLRGITYFFLEVSGQSKDLHSGKFGGAIQEPMTVICLLTLVSGVFCKMYLFAGLDHTAAFSGGLKGSYQG